MSEEASRSNGVFLPYPLLGLLMTLILALGGGIIGLYGQLSAMNATMIMRDSDYRQQQDKQERQIEILHTYIKDDREKIVRLEERAKLKAGY